MEIDPATFPDVIEDVVWHLGRPNADPITLSSQALFAAVRGAGFKAVLTGDGADEVFGGYDRMRARCPGRGPAAGVEARLPFCRPGVVALGRGLPDEYRVRGEQVKRALYAAAAGLLPEPVLNRPEQPFTLPVTAMLRPGRPLWDYTRDLLTPHRLRRDGRIDPTAVTALFDAQENRPGARPALALWSLMIHEAWREQFGASANRVAHEVMSRSATSPTRWGHPARHWCLIKRQNLLIATN